MGEYKFRAWDKTSEEMYKVMEIKYYEDEIEVIGTYYEGYYKSICKRCEDTVLMQFTGLKDKNGVEIYEGDIVKCTALGTEEIVTIEDIMRIPAELMWKSIYKKNASLEVIGNIYESPELLEDN